jgi:acid phosphatase (class A)
MLALLAGSSGLAAQTAPTPASLPGGLAAAPTAATARPQPGYFAPGTAPDVMRVLPPPPLEGDVRDTADLAVFRTTRRLEGSPRWAIAQRDNTLGTPALLQSFSCALDVAVTPDNAPAVARLITRATADASAASRHAKDVFGRKRPYQRAEGAVCLSAPDIERLTRSSSDYPSGHATTAWMTGRVLAEVAPDRSAEILERARTFGESRVVCGVHHVTAVEAGRLTAEAVLAALHGVAAFNADIDAARAELSRLRTASRPTADACRADAVALAERPY